MAVALNSKLTSVYDVIIVKKSSVKRTYPLMQDSKKCPVIMFLFLFLFELFRNL